MTARWWDEPPRPSKQQGRRPPAPDFGRPPPRPSFPRWSISAVAYGVQAAACSGILFVVFLAFLLIAPVLGLAGADISEGSLLAVGILVLVVVRIFGLTLQVRYLVRHGAAQAVSACLTAAVAAAIVCGLAGLAGLPDPGVLLVGVVLEITMVALMIRPAPSRSW